MKHVPSLEKLSKEIQMKKAKARVIESTPPQSPQSPPTNSTIELEEIRTARPIPRKEIEEVVARHKSLINTLRKGYVEAKEIGFKLSCWKDLIPHGKWQKWIGMNIPEIGERSARNYMQIWEHHESIEIKFDPQRLPKQNGTDADLGEANSSQSQGLDNSLPPITINEALDYIRSTSMKAKENAKPPTPSTPSPSTSPKREGPTSWEKPDQGGPVTFDPDAEKPKNTLEGWTNVITKSEKSEPLARAKTTTAKEEAEAELKTRGLKLANTFDKEPLLWTTTIQIMAEEKMLGLQKAMDVLVGLKESMPIAARGVVETMLQDPYFAEIAMNFIRDNPQVVENTK